MNRFLPDTDILINHQRLPKIAAATGILSLLIAGVFMYFHILDAFFPKSVEGFSYILLAGLLACLIAIMASIVFLYAAFRKRNMLLGMSERRYRSIVEDQTECIVRWKPDGTILFANGNYRNYRETAEGELAGSNLYSFMDPDDAESVRGIIGVMTPEDPVIANEHRFSGHGRGIAWEQWINRGIFDDNRVLVEIQSVGRDITDLKRAKEALSDSEAKYRFLVENVGDIAFILDLNLNSRYISPSLEKVLGFTAEERQGRSPLERISESSREMIIQTLASEMERERNDSGADPHRTIRMEFQYLHKDGSVRILDAFIHGLRDERGRLEAMYGVCHDITDRKKAEEEIRQSEARFKFLAENMGDIAFIVGLDMKTIYVSPNVERVLGFTPEERMRQTLEEQLTLESLLLASETLRRELEREGNGSRSDPNRAITLELEYYHKNGSVRVLETTFRVMRDDTGRVESIYGLSHDITDRKETEQWLKNSLEEKDMLLKEIHHRVKNNMQIISSLLDLQKNISGGKNPDELFTVCQRRIRAMALVHEKLYQSGNFSSINFKDYLVDLVRECKSGISGNGTVSFSVDSVDLFMGINQAIPCALILNELITNALKHAFRGRDGGAISVDLAGDGDGRYSLTICDDGIGMPEGYDVKGSTTLGYQLITGLVNQIHGSLYIHAGSGTKVTVTFPT